MINDSANHVEGFVHERDLPNPLPEGKFIPAGDDSVLLRNEDLYPQRFKNFSDCFYKQITGTPYPLDYINQNFTAETQRR